jgi:hypothetical protein
MANLTWKWTIGRSALAHPERAEAIFAEEFRRGTNEGLLFWQRQASQLAPVGISGRLRSGYFPQLDILRPLTVIGSLRSNVPYSLPIETGTRPFWPPYGKGTDLARWAEVKGLSAFLVARAISRRGIKPQRVVRRALAIVRPVIYEGWRAAFKRVKQRLERV